MLLRHSTVHDRELNIDTANFSRSGFTHQVRLNRHHLEAFSPNGVFECRVPDSNGVLQIAPIILSEHSNLASSSCRLSAGGSRGEPGTH